MLVPVAEKAATLRQQKVLSPFSFASPRPALVAASLGGTFRINSNIVLAPSSTAQSSTEAQWVPQRFDIVASETALSRSSWHEPAVSHVMDTVQSIMDAINNACTSAISCVYDFVSAIIHMCLLRLGLHSHQQAAQAASPVAEQQSSIRAESPEEHHVMPASSARTPIGSYARLLQRRCACVQQAVTSLPLYTTFGGLPVGYRLGVLAAALLAAVLPAALIAHRSTQARKREQEVLRTINASSLVRQKQRMAAALAFDAINVELPTIAGAEVDPNTLPVEAVAISLVESESLPASSDSLLTMEASMRSEWEQFTAASKVRLVRDLWDARSAAAEEAELAPRASRAQLEEMSRRIKNANKNADGSEILDPPPSLDGEGGAALEPSGITWGDSSLQGSGATSLGSLNSSGLGEDWEGGLAERAARRKARFAAAAGRAQPNMQAAAEPAVTFHTAMLSSDQHVVVEAAAMPGRGNSTAMPSRAAHRRRSISIRASSIELSASEEQTGSEQAQPV